MYVCTTGAPSHETRNKIVNECAAAEPLFREITLVWPGYPAAFQ
jgi:hypothetical protein